MPFLKSNENVTWTTTSGLSIVSFNNINKTVTVTPTTANVAGVGSITASYNSGGNILTKSYQVRYGPPVSTDVTLINNSNGASANNGGTISFVPYSSNYLQVNSNITNIIGANWVFPSGWQTGSNGSNTNVVYNWNNTFGTISIFPSNSCGTAMYPAIFNVSPNYYGYRISPNPATSYISIDFEDASELDLLPEEIVLTQEKNLKKVKQVKIKDIFNQELKKTKKITIDVNNLERGLYFLEIKTPKRLDLTVESYKIILV